jgi:hypothetical protein
MAILGQVTIDEIAIYSVSADPSADGFAAAIGSIASLDDDTNGRLWIKSGAGNTAWSIIPRLPSATAYTQGSIPFADANGFLAQNNAQLFWDNTNNRLGLGITSPQNRIHIDNGTATASAIRFTAGATTGQTSGDGFTVGIDAAGNADIRQNENSHINFYTNGSRTMRLNSGGELIIGLNATSVDISGLSTFPQFQIVGSSIGDVQMAAIKYGADTLPPVFNLLKSRGTAQSQGLLAADDEFGRLQFRGSDGVNFQAGASVRAAVDGTPGAGSMPGRLIFMTTASGSTAPTERLRIDAIGQAIFASSIRLGNGSDTTNGNIRYDGSEFLAREGSAWRLLTMNPIALTATANTSTTSATFSVITGMTTTPAAGTYLVLFSANCNTTGANTNGDIQLHVDAVAVGETLRNVGNTASFGTTTVSVSISFQAVVTVNGAQAVDVRFRENGGGTFNVSNRGFYLIPISR